ncbi:hypothetical protein GC197_11365 [bacterium]|nr:hypothetical protein [bacterium]
MESTPEPVPTPPARTSVWLDWQWYLVLVLALAIRGAVGYAQLENYSDDPDGYRLLARNILQLQSFTLEDPVEPTAFRPPLYPLVLAFTGMSGEISPTDVLMLHVSLGVITVGLTFFWATQIGLARWRSLAAMMVAIDPILLNQSTLVMTETLATCLAILTLVAVAAVCHTLEEAQEVSLNRDFTIRSMNVAGAVALAIYCRPTFLVWAALLPLVLLACTKKWSLRATSIAAYGMTLVFLLAPWVVRNVLVFEAPVIGTTHGGHTLLWSNNDSYYEYLKSGKEPVWDNQEFHEGFSNRHPYLGTSASELERDRAAYREAFKAMQQNPGMAAYSSLVRLGMFWRPLPHAINTDESGTRRMVRYAIGAWYLVQFALVIVGLIALGKRLWQPGWMAALMLVGSFTLVHMFFWSNMRMRSPLVPVLAVLACAGTQWVVGRLGKR